MKMWRRMAQKLGRDEQGRRQGRKIKHQFQMREQLFKNGPKTYPMLHALFVRAGITKLPVVVEQAPELPAPVGG